MPARSLNAARRRVLAALRQDHREIAAAFAAALAQPPAAQAPFVEEALASLERHARLEEAAFYPAVRALAAERVDEAQVEHEAMAGLVAQLRAGGPSDAKYLARLKVLDEYLRHHVAEEEAALFAALEHGALAWDAIEAALAGRRGPDAAAPPAGRRAPRGGQKV
jgi:hypothetical protein